jgi:hypothetical protein
MRRHFLWLTLGSALLSLPFAPGGARAQMQSPAQATPLQPSVWPLAPNPQLAPLSLLSGEPSNGPGLSPWIASVPLRLSLQSGIFPMAGLFPNCATREDGSGNSFQGAPLQRYALLRLTPNLVLHGFSSAGCPIDGALGGGVTYTVPLRPSLWLVAGAGIYSTPAYGAALPARQQSDVRIDLMKETSGGRSLSVGVGKRGFSFGGSF